MELPKITPVVQFFTAAFALAVGGYSAGEKFGWFRNDIIVWAPEHFRIVDTKANRPASAHNYANVDVRAIRADLKDKGLADAEIDAFVEKFLAR